MFLLHFRPLSSYLYPSSYSYLSPYLTRYLSFSIRRSLSTYLSGSLRWRMNEWTWKRNGQSYSCSLAGAHLPCIYCTWLLKKKKKKIRKRSQAEILWDRITDTFFTYPFYNLFSSCKVTFRPYYTNILYWNFIYSLFIYTILSYKIFRVSH